MKRAYWVVAVGAASAGLLVLQACSDGGGDNDGGTDAANDNSQQNDVTKQDAPGDSPNDSPIDAPVDAPAEGAACATWMDTPDAGQNLVPDGGLPPLVLHAAASGTQNYVCEAQNGDAGTTYAWVFVGPQANLDDCNAKLIGHHFASEAGAAAPEWQTIDQSYVIGAKQAAFTADASAVPWLLVKETSTGGSGTISKTLWVQRLYTSGGIAPTTTCDVNTVNNTSNVAYTADYYFYGQ